MIRKLIFSTLSMAVLLFTGCSKEEGPVTSQNKVLLDGKAFQINSATIIGVSISGQGHAGISLISGDFSASSYKVITMDVEYSGNSSVEGTYSYPQGVDKYMDDFLSNYTVFSGTQFIETELESGTVTVKKNTDSNYTVTMNLTMLDGSHFTGTYQGDFVVTFNNG